MKGALVLFALLISGKILFAQDTGYVPFAESEKAIALIENRPEIFDSLRRIYKQRWTIGLAFGQRYINKSNLANKPDIITFTDFTNKETFFGLEGGYFITTNFQVFLSLDILPLPKKKNINNASIGNNGLQVDGSGSGGAMVNGGIGAKYFVNISPFTRLYTGLKFGQIKVVAEGGTGGFTQSQGQFQQTKRLTRTYQYGHASIGFAHRLSPSFMADFNLGYLQASRSESIGGIISPGGITSTLTLHLLIGKGNQIK